MDYSSGRALQTTNEQKILVIDGDPFNNKYLSKYLDHHGYNVTSAKDGTRALNLLRKTSFDLVLLNLTIRDMDGITLLKELREEYRGVELPVIIFTPQNKPQNMIACLQAGANDYITRPVDMAVTLARVKTQLRLKEQAETCTGDLRRLSGEVRAITRPNKFYCPGCLRAQADPNAHRCPDCEHSRPRMGWKPTRNSPWPHLGRTLGGRYKLDRFIDKGAAGHVYQATDVDLGREFAIKIVDLAEMPTETHETTRERILTEIKALVRLKNPHTVRIYQVLKLENDVWALVMEFCQGQSLEDVLYEQGRLEPWLALDVAHQVCSALHEAHSQGILHRDIKPANIMLEQMTTGEYFVRVLDFGLAMMMDHRPEKNDRCGTPEYVPPEVLTAEGPIVDERADIYSLGATLYHMLTGHPPFEGEDTRSILMKHIYTPLPTLPRGIVSTSTARLIHRLLRRMMAKNPELRFKNVETLLFELSALTAHALSEAS